MATLVNTKLGEHRGKKRVWLEGKKLEREGYLPGTRFDLAMVENTVVLTPTEHGRFTVSKRERNGNVSPIIDINTSELASLFDGVEVLRVLIQRGKIVISAHQHIGNLARRVKRLAERVSAGETIQICSLFHGGGILDKAIHRGLRSGGIRSVISVAVERCDAYLDSSLRNNPEIWSDSSIAIESPIEWINVQGKKQEVDLLVAGIPCVGASVAGISKNKLSFAEEHETAGAMFFYFLQFVQTLNPSLILLENVPNYGSTAGMAVIRSVLSSLGYSIQESVFDSADFGAIEKRKRLCVLATSNDINGLDLMATKRERCSELTINDILEPIELDSKRWKSFDYLAEKEKRDSQSGKGFKRQLLRGNERHCGTIGAQYAKCRSTEPFLVHPTNSQLSRLLTPLEHSRVKGVPTECINGLSDTIAHQVLGQSVVFPVFEAIGKMIGEALSALYSLKPLAQESN